MARTRSTGPALAAHIVAVAARLFYREGIHVVGVDRIAAEAEITKRTLYRYFRSKEELVAATLREDLGLRFPSSGEPLERIRGAFEILAGFLQETDFRGCPYINAAAQLADRLHPARRIVVEATARRRAWFRKRAAEAGLRSPDVVAEQLDVLFDGALANSMKRADLAPLRAAIATVDYVIAAATRLDGEPSFEQRRLRAG